MDYQPISNLFFNLKNLVDFKQKRLDLVVGVVTQIIKKELNKDVFLIKNKVIYIKTNPLIKNQILIKKDLILEQINNKLNIKDKIIDIK